MLILGIESTCDESSVSIIESPRSILANVVKSQIDEHARFGGVVPEVASRLHLNYLLSATHSALKKADKKVEQIDVISVSHRPGLIGGLLVGTTIAKTLAYLLKKPLVMVDHLQGHLMAPDLIEPIIFPCVAGIFSGAHSNIYYGESYTKWTLLARSRDDAPGEAFDKTAKLLGLSYPGGPAIQRFAEQGDEKLFDLPLPLPKSLGGDFSFSGLKTAVLYHVKGTNGKRKCSKEQWPSLAASFQVSIARGLTKRLIECAEEHDVNAIYIGGGVAANSRLRKELEEECMKVNKQAFFPSLPLCMDNGAMIARAGNVLYREGCVSTLSEEVCSRSVLGL